MKLCCCSRGYENLISIILEDNIKNFKLFSLKNYTGQIDKKPLLNFCLESNSTKIIKNLIKNQEFTNTTIINRKTLQLLLKNKSLNISEKTYIYTKLLKKRLKITDKLLLKDIMQNDTQALIWLNKSKNFTQADYQLLCFSELDKNIFVFLRLKQVNIVKILLKANKIQPINFEDHSHLFSYKELSDFVQDSLNSLNKNNLDINLIDSIIKILINHQYLIDQINIDSLRKVHIENEDFFNFLNLDIERVLLYNKFSQKKFKEKVNKI